MTTFTFGPRSQEAVRLVQFVAAWEELADNGRVDALGGCQFRRVFGEWCIEDGGLGLEDFILHHLLDTLERDG